MECVRYKQKQQQPNQLKNGNKRSNRAGLNTKTNFGGFEFTFKAFIRLSTLTPRASDRAPARPRSIIEAEARERARTPSGCPSS